jgi:hypothetical protein
MLKSGGPVKHAAPKPRPHHSGASRQAVANVRFIAFILFGYTPRRANALLLLDDGMSCTAIAKVLLLNDDTIRTWYRLYREDWIKGLASFNHEWGSFRLTWSNRTS